MSWWFWLVLYGPAPFFARAYYKFLRDRSARKPRHMRACAEHGDYSRSSCCFTKEKNFQPWPDYLSATIAIMVSGCWPVIALVFFVMAKPKPTSFEIEEERRVNLERIAELQRELAEIESKQGREQQ